MKPHAPLVILALIAACSEDSEECRYGTIEECTVSELEPTMNDGTAWPRYGEALRELQQGCTQTSCDRWRHGLCADGKRFIDRNGGFTSEARFFREESLVGLWRAGDVASCFDGLLCWGQGAGDTRCVETEAETIDCPCLIPDAGLL